MASTSDLIHQGTDFFNQGNVAGFASLYAEDAVLTTPDGQFEGSAAITAYMDALLVASPDAAVQVGRSATDGDLYLGEFVVRATNTGPLATPDGSEIPATGKPYESAGVEVATSSNGKITRHEMYWDNMGLLGQLGLLPAP